MPKKKKEKITTEEGSVLTLPELYQEIRSRDISRPAFMGAIVDMGKQQQYEHDVELMKKGLELDGFMTIGEFMDGLETFLAKPG